MAFALDLAAYFERIAYTGSREPCLATLQAITTRHVQSIPFENLDVLLGRSISIEPEAVERKLVRGRRGGYCFEQNTLLMHALQVLGFAVTPLSARVRLQRPRDYTPARTHMFLRIDLEGEAFLADVGVGGLSLAGALRLVPDVRQETAHEPRRIVREGQWSELALRAPEARLFHQAYFASAWHDVYDFTLEPMPAIDREVANWFTSTHPASHFRNRLMVARASSEGRITLHDRELSMRGRDGLAESKILGSAEELLDALDKHFGLRFPAGTRFNCAALAALT
jgi:N-hydroxyarylamine O-acetyltransferase